MLPLDGLEFAGSLPDKPEAKCFSAGTNPKVSSRFCVTAGTDPSDPWTG